MPANIEIKAKARNFERQKQLAQSISDVSATILVQEDTFYNTSRGRLKLRVLSSGQGELIYYERVDALGPKKSNYLIFKTTDPHTLHQVLLAAHGIRGVVRKKRILFISGQIRIHVDEVEDLGQFLELEVVMKPGQNEDEGTQMAVHCMQQLEIMETDLIQGAYLDLLTARQD